VGVVILFSSVPQITPSFTYKIVNRLRLRPAAQMGVAKSDFSQMRRSRSDLNENVERFAQIDLDLSDFEKECSQ